MNSTEFKVIYSEGSRVAVFFSQLFACLEIFKVFRTVFLSKVGAVLSFTAAMHTRTLRSQQVRLAHARCQTQSWYSMRHGRARTERLTHALKKSENFFSF